MSDQNDPKNWGKRTSARVVAAHFADQVANRVILLTGPTVGGVGYATALALAEHCPALMVLAGRTPSKLEESRDRLQQDVPNVPVRLLQVDLSDMSSVRHAANEVNGYPESIDIVINNAAVVCAMSSRPRQQADQQMDTPYTLTKDGFELQLASNYLGHWLLLNLVLPKVLAGQNKRIVHVSSIGHLGGNVRWEDPHFKQDQYDRKKAYSQSKTAMCLHSIELTRRYGGQGLTSFSLHPGGIETPLQQYWSHEDRMQMNKDAGFSVYKEDGSANLSEETPWKTPDQGASTSVRAALDPTIAAHSGEYMDDCQLAPGNAKDYAKDAEAAQRAWDWTNDILGTSF